MPRSYRTSLSRLLCSTFFTTTTLLLAPNLPTSRSYAVNKPRRRFVSTHQYSAMETEEREGPVWDPVNQIYVGGVVPENAEVQQMIQDNHGCLRLFGYGSLCWNPGTGPLAHPTTHSKLGRARGYRRCWAQKSTDHRGLPQFPGIVCTLLKDDEVRQFRPLPYAEETLTEGVIYEVPPELVEECLAELDFREKGVRTICAPFLTSWVCAPFRIYSESSETLVVLSTCSFIPYGRAMLAISSMWSRTIVAKPFKRFYIEELLTIRLFGLACYAIFHLLPVRANFVYMFPPFKLFFNLSSHTYLLLVV